MALKLGVIDSVVDRIKSQFHNWSDWISYEGNPIAVGDEVEPKDE